MKYLRDELLFGSDDPLFPATKVGTGKGGGFENQGLSRQFWKTPASAVKIIQDAFEAAGIERFHPHSFRKTITRLGERTCQTPEEFKAWSQNMGHDNPLTTFTSYGHISAHRQSEIIKGLSE